MFIADITVAVSIGSDEDQLVGFGEEDQTHFGQVLDRIVLDWIVLDGVYAIVDDEDLMVEVRNDVLFPLSLSLSP